MAEYNEKEALALLAKGDERGLKAIYDRYARQIFRVCDEYLHDEDAAMDVVQDLFIKLWGPKRQIFLSKKEFKPYFFRVARNSTLLMIRDLHIRQKAQDRFMKQQPPPIYNPFEEKDDKMDLVMKAVEKMPRQRKQVFTLGHLRGLSHEEIAEELQLSPLTVNNHMTFALNHIRNFTTPPPPKPKKKKKISVLDEIQLKVIELRKNGLTYTEIANQLNISRTKAFKTIHQAF